MGIGWCSRSYRPHTKRLFTARRSRSLPYVDGEPPLIFERSATCRFTRWRFNRVILSRGCLHPKLPFHIPSQSLRSPEVEDFHVANGTVDLLTSKVMTVI